MGTEDEVRATHERTGFRQRFLAEDIQRGARHPSLPKGEGEGVFVHHTAARRVDEVGRRLHAAQLLRPDHGGGGGGEGHVEAEEVRPLDHVVEVARLRVQLLRAGCGQIGIVDQHPHAEDAGAARHLPTDPSRPDQPERLAVELHSGELGRPPSHRAHRAVRGDDLARERQDERKGELGGGDGVARGRVQHRDAALGGGVEVDVVHPGSGPPDDFEVGGRLDQFPGDPGGAAHDNGVRPGHRLVLLRRRAVRQPAHLEAPVAGERAKPGGRDLVRHRDHVRSALLVHRLPPANPSPGDARRTSSSASSTRSSSSNVWSPMWPMRTDRALSPPYPAPITNPRSFMA